MPQNTSSIDNFLTRDDTTVMKGIAICCMLMHHLWYFPSRIANAPLENLFTIFGISTPVYFGLFGNICVPMFFFFGGYGIYKSNYGKKYDLIVRLKKLYFAYWKVFLIFIPIGFIFFSSQTPYSTDFFVHTRFSNFSSKELVSNFLGFTASYNREWWFLSSYAFALLTFPIIRGIIDRFSAKTNILIVIIVTLLLTNIFPGIRLSKTLGVLGSNMLYFKFFCQSAPYAACFWMGAVTARNGLLDRLNESAKKNNLLNPVTDIAIWFIVIFLRQSELGLSFDIFYIPALTVASIDLLSRVKKLKKGFGQLGRQSTSMWLIHPFFCYYFGTIAKVVTAPRHIILCLLVLIAMSYLASVIVDLFWKGIGLGYGKAKARILAIAAARKN